MVTQIQASNSRVYFEVDLSKVKYQEITIQAAPLIAPDRGLSEFRRPTLRLGRISHTTDGFDYLAKYEFHKSAPLKTGALLNFYQDNVEEGKTKVRQPVLFYPFLVARHFRRQRAIDIIVLVLEDNQFLRHQPPIVRLISPDEWVDQDLYRRMRENMAQDGTIRVSNSEMEYLCSKSLGENGKAVAVFKGDTLSAKCVASDFLGVPSWTVEFEVTRKDYAHSFRFGRKKSTTLT